MPVKAFNTGKFAEKVLAMATYDGAILTDLYQNPVNKTKINRGAAILVKNYFSQYIDARAKQNPDAYHHIYEFNKTGESSSRLFKCDVTSAVDGSAVINYSFTPAKIPNDQGYMFANKAEVMETGNPLSINAKRGEYLKFVLDDGRFITTSHVVVRQPGGPEVKKSFENTFKRFMATQPPIILKKARYYERIELAMIGKRRLMIPRINAGLVSDAINRARMDAAQITGGISTTYA